MGVISRYPLVQNTRQRLSPARPVPLLTRLFSPDHTVQMVDVQCGTQTLRLFNVYLDAHDIPTRQRQVRELVEFVRQVATPVSVLIGAFNTARRRMAGEGRDTDPSAEQTMRLVLDDLSGRFRAVAADELPAPATASRVSVPHILIGSGVRAVETHLMPLPASSPRTCPWWCISAGLYRWSSVMGEAIMSASEIVATLLRELVSLHDICLVIGPNEAVCEAFVDPATMDFRIDGTFATMENGPWHVHMDMTRVRKITFEVKPDTAHNSDQLSYSVRFFNADRHGTAAGVFSGYV